MNALLVLALVVAIFLAPQVSITLNDGGSTMAIVSPAGVTATQVEEEVRRLAGPESKKPLWPGFDALTVPLAIFDGSATWLFRHPSPPGAFHPVSGAPAAVSTMSGRHEAVTANTSADLGGVTTATVLLDREYPGRTLTDLAAMAIHEAFHVFQRERHPGWSANEGDLFNYPSENASLLALRRLETEALEKAVNAERIDAAAAWSRLAVALRAERYAAMDSALSAYERKTELNEGIATHIELKAGGRSDLRFPEGEFGPAEVRLRAYTTGPAFARLLDRFSPGWVDVFEKDDERYLDLELARALPRGAAASFPASRKDEARSAAERDVAELQKERARAAQEFESRPGWRLVLVPSSGSPLWPQGFDPLNVQAAGDGRVLHTRYLKLGNDAGTIEVIDVRSLTEPAGPHPLFNGVRRLVVTGLERPSIDESDGAITVTAPGVKGTFRGAAVDHAGNEITIRLK